MSTITTITKTCDCGKTYETTHDPAWKLLTATECPDCEAKHQAEWEEHQRLEAERREQQELEATLKRFEKQAQDETPDRILGTDTSDSRFNAKLWRQVTAWNPSKEKPWLGLIGDPGECKTRCAYLRLMQFAREDAANKRRFSCASITGMDFAKLVAQQFDRTEIEGVGSEWRPVRTTRGAVACQTLEALRDAAFLVFDELGKVKPTAGTMDELFGLIDHRHAHNLTTIWTSNTTPEKFCTGWPEEYAGPGCGRILESSTIIKA